MQKSSCTALVIDSFICKSAAIQVQLRKKQQPGLLPALFYLLHSLPGQLTKIEVKFCWLFPKADAGFEYQIFLLKKYDPFLNATTF